MNTKIILAGLANHKTSLGEVFRRYIDCFKTFSNPDIFDLGQYTKLKNDQLNIYDQYNKDTIPHDIKYFHTTFPLYNALKKQTVPVKKTNAYKIGYFVWESSKLHDEHIPILNDFDEIWTASNYCKTTFSNYINSEKIKVIPHPIPVPNKIQTKYKNFTILVLGNISSDAERKNIVQTIKAAYTLKEYNKKINIVFKTTSFYEIENLAISNIQKEFPKIKIINDYYDSEKIQRLIGKCHVLISLHKSEGYGLTLAEALAQKTIPLATNYSGNIDFMNTDNSFLVDYKLEKITNPNFNGEWANPDINDAIAKLEYIFKNYESLDDMRNNGYNFIKNNLSHSVISNLIETQIVDKFGR